VSEKNNFRFVEAKLHLSGLPVVISNKALRSFTESLRYIPRAFRVPVRSSECYFALLRLLSESDISKEHADIIVTRLIRHKNREVTYYCHPATRLRFVVRLIENDSKIPLPFYRVLTVERKNFFGRKFQEKMMSHPKWLKEDTSEEEEEKFMQTHRRDIAKMNRRRMMRNSA
jgi:hypothetical protein